MHVAIEGYCVEIHCREKERKFLILFFVIEQIQTCTVYVSQKSLFNLKYSHMRLPIVALKYN